MSDAMHEDYDEEREQHHDDHDDAPHHHDNVPQESREAMQRVLDILSEPVDLTNVAPRLPLSVNQDDVRGVTVVLGCAPNEEIVEILRSIVSAVETWALNIVAPLGVETGAPVASVETRAFRVLFRSTVQAMTSTAGIDMRVDGDTVLRGTNLINEATERRTLQTFYVGLIMKMVGVVTQDLGDTDLDARIQRTADVAKRACRMISVYKDSANVVVSGVTMEFSEGTDMSSEYTDFLGLEPGKNKVAYHVREIMQDLVRNRQRRLPKYDYRPEDSSSITNSAAETTQPLESLESIKGIYQSVRMVARPSKVWFDADTRKIIGEQVMGEVVPFSLMVEEYRLLVDPGSPRDLLEFASSEHVATEAWDDIHTRWLQRFFDDEVLLAVECSGPRGCGRCCDYMHCREWQLPCKRHHSRPRMHGNFSEVPFASPTGEDPLLSSNAHTFTPVMEKLEAPINTNAFSKCGSVEDFVKIYFDPSRNPKAADDALMRDVIQAVMTWGKDLKWFPELEVNANHHVYAFSDAMVVADPNLVDCPEIHPHTSHVFAPGGKYHNVHTVKVDPSVCCRPDSIKRMIASVLPALSLARHEFLALRYGKAWQSVLSPDQIRRIPDPVHCCGCCGLERRECVTVNQLLAFEGRHTCSTREMAEKAMLIAPSQGTPLRLQDMLHSMEHMRGNQSSVVDRHTFQPYRNPTRGDCGNVARVIELTQFDEIINTQLENPDMWDAMPMHLRVPESPEEGTFYREEIRKMHYEIRAMLGRLLHRNREFRTCKNGFDRWQAFLFIKGASGTGKSTILSIIENIVGKENVGIIDCATWEPQFGLANVILSDVVAVNEMSGEVKFSANTILQMVDGSRMAAPRKNRDAYMGEMKGPIILLGNRAPNTRLKAGQWERRQLLLGFERVMTDRRSKPSMDQEIHALHLPHLIISLYTAYWSMIEERGHMDIWKTTEMAVGKRYDTFSWAWHHQKAKSECQNNALGRVLRKLEENSTNENPSTLMHSNFALRPFLSLIRSKEHWFSPTDNVWRLTPENVKERKNVKDEIKSMFGIPDVLTESGDFADFQPTVPYMPFENTQFPANEDTGRPEQTHPGFKTLCNQTMISIQGGGSRMVTALPWGDEEDFYRAAFSSYNLHVYEGKLPYPPWTPELVHATWIIGITDRATFRETESTVHESFDALKTSIREKRAAS